MCLELCTKTRQRFPQKCNLTMQYLKGPLYLDFQEILPWYHMPHQGVKQLCFCPQCTILQLLNKKVSQR